MTFDFSTFNADEQEPMATGFELLPNGQYPIMFTDAIWKETKAQNGHYLFLTAVVTDGDFEDRKLFVNLNLDNPSEKAVEIAKRELGAIGRAVGVVTMKEASNLLDLPLLCDVVVEPAKDNFPAKNKITAYHPLTVNKPKQATGGTKKAPWGK